ncbi:hypothetical protein MYCTH_2126239 [Thermothelomyces thermophilus ATCC 42464]|uniref:NmrA-like domain-containing protein n=1 Tax=Thermothelomyces thermophilus (strain ATCC 42464 / BCRC 31852 / DSM 1799) TaxID=573729 RepID=G2QC16_THET4|nr:uncharacterized protein MYCTH_2126239 [Thermothelomyces thermophilus ATCC 42464]AEO57243.1 hypothetical protein MYCTH_2126239 [Thermothelomyces thermophilus ATCC 42464]
MVSEEGNTMDNTAAAVAESLDDNGLLASTLSHAAKCSGGKLKDLYHFDAKADVFPDYVAAAHPKLAAKMSCIHTGFFTTSHRILPSAYFSKPVPHLDVNADTGSFVCAVHQMPPGGAYIHGGGRVYLSWPEFAAAWARVTGAAIRYREISVAEMVDHLIPHPDLGLEVALMFAYSSEPGYDGGMRLLRAGDLRKGRERERERERSSKHADIDCLMLTVEESLARQEWAAVLGQQ